MAADIRKVSFALPPDEPESGYRLRWNEGVGKWRPMVQNAILQRVFDIMDLEEQIQEFID